MILLLLLFREEETVKSGAEDGSGWMVVGVRTITNVAAGMDCGPQPKSFDPSKSISIGIAPNTKSLPTPTLLLLL